MEDEDKEKGKIRSSGKKFLSKSRVREKSASGVLFGCFFSIKSKKICPAADSSTTTLSTSLQSLEWDSIEEWIKKSHKGKNREWK